jgi:hypothetical protein
MSLTDAPLMVTQDSDSSVRPIVSKDLLLHCSVDGGVGELLGEGPGGVVRAEDFGGES